jgi:transposase
MDVIGFLCLSLGSSTVKSHASLGSIRACPCSVAGLNSQHGDRAWGVYYWKAECCALLWTEGLNVKDTHKETFPVYGGKYLSRKAVHNWVEKFSQGRSEVADDARSGRSVEIATEVTVQKVEVLIRGDRRITIDSVATTRGCSHGLAYSTMHDYLMFRKVCARWVPREEKDRERWTEWVCPCNIPYGMQMKEKIWLTG